MSNFLKKQIEFRDLNMLRDILGEYIGKPVDNVLKVLLGQSYWNTKDINYLFPTISNITLKNIVFLFNVINFFLMYVYLSTPASIIFQKETRIQFIKVLEQFFKKNPAPLGLYILGRAMANDTTFSSTISKLQPKFYLNKIKNVPNLYQFLLDVGIRHTTKNFIEIFLKKKIKIDG